MPVPDERAAAWIDLALRPLPARALASLLQAFGSPESVCAATRAQVGAVAGPAAAAALAAPPDAERRAAALRWLAEPGNDFLAWDDPDYPQALLQLADAPCVLYFRGRRELVNLPALAIVGSRNATPEGVETARAFARTLAGAGLVIVSGLAIGIDGAAHAGALDAGGGTLAVVGTGLDRVYPPRHEALAKRIGTEGGLLSEFPPGTPPLPAHFPRRNRLISGLARGVLVVEAAASSGSLVTARCAVEQGREVFAIPGSIHSAFSKGPHRLIREGAKLVETAQDVLDELGIAARPAAAAGAGDAPPRDPGHADVLRAMGRAPVGLDQLAVRSGLPTEAIAAALTELELAGRVSPVPGGRWQRLA